MAIIQGRWYSTYTSSKIKQEIQAAQYSTTRTTATISRFGHGGLSARLLLSSDVPYSIIYKQYLNLSGS